MWVHIRSCLDDPQFVLVYIFVFVFLFCICEFMWVRIRSCLDVPAFTTTGFPMPSMWRTWNSYFPHNYVLCSRLCIVTHVQICNDLNKTFVKNAVGNCTLSANIETMKQSLSVFALLSAHVSHHRRWAESCNKIFFTYRQKLFRNYAICSACSVCMSHQRK